MKLSCYKSFITHGSQVLHKIVYLITALRIQQYRPLFLINWIFMPKANDKKQIVKARRNKSQFNPRNVSAQRNNSRAFLETSLLNRLSLVNFLLCYHVNSDFFITTSYFVQLYLLQRNINVVGWLVFGSFKKAIKSRLKWNYVFQHL